jgi:hypothetical protein
MPIEPMTQNDQRNERGQQSALTALAQQYARGVAARKKKSVTQTGTLSQATVPQTALGSGDRLAGITGV